MTAAFHNLEIVVRSMPVTMRGIHLGIEISPAEYAAAPFREQVPQCEAVAKALGPLPSTKS